VKGEQMVNSTNQ